MTGSSHVNSGNQTVAEFGPLLFAVELATEDLLHALTTAAAEKLIDMVHGTPTHHPGSDSQSHGAAPHHTDITHISFEAPLAHDASPAAAIPFEAPHAPMTAGNANFTDPQGHAIHIEGSAMPFEAPQPSGHEASGFHSSHTFSFDGAHASFATGWAGGDGSGSSFAHQPSQHVDGSVTH